MALAEYLKAESHLTDEQVTIVVNIVKYLETQNPESYETPTEEEVMQISDRIMEENQHIYEVLAQ